MSKTILYTTGIATGGLLGLSGYYHLKRKKQDKLTGLLATELSKRFDPAGTELGDAFKVDYIERVLKNADGRVIILKEQTAAQYARDIYNAWGSFNDDEHAIYNVFRKLKDKVQVAQVAKAYATAYHKNLIDILKSKLWDSELKTVMKIINPLPPYRTK